MARIRSVHPGLFTDECFASLSMTARVLLIGIWTEADDAGVFEWKPVTLKMRIFPADNVDVPAALEEIEAAGAVKRFDAGGKVYGSVRNFCKYQRPKTPKSHHPLPDHIRKWTGVKDGEFPQNGETTSAEPEPFPQNGEIASQMEDGGGRREEGEGSDTSLRSVSAADDEHPQDRFWSLAPAAEKAGIRRSQLGQLANVLAGDFIRAIGVVQDSMAAKTPRVYFARIVANLKSERAEPDGETYRRPGDPKHVPAWVLERREAGADIRWKPPDRWVWGNEEYDDDEELRAA